MKFKLNKFTCFSTFILTILVAIFLIHKFGVWALHSFSIVWFLFQFIFFITCAFGWINLLLYCGSKEFRNDKEIQPLRSFINIFVFISSIISLFLMLTLSIEYFNRLEKCGIWLNDNKKIEFLSEISGVKREIILRKCENKTKDREKVIEMIKKYCFIDDSDYDIYTPLSKLKEKCINEINLDIGNVLLDKNKEDYIKFFFEKKERLIKDLKQFNL